MRLINADRLLTDRMKSKYYHLPNGDTAIPIIDIEHAPTIDAIEVIRCKDCKHWYADADTGMACEYTNMGQPEDGYCNWAERREDGEA